MGTSLIGKNSFPLEFAPRGSELFPLRTIPYAMINHFYRIGCSPLNITIFTISEPNHSDRNLHILATFHAQWLLMYMFTCRYGCSHWKRLYALRSLPCLMVLNREYNIGTCCRVTLGSGGHLGQMFKTAVVCLFCQIKIIP